MPRINSQTKFAVQGRKNEHDNKKKISSAVDLLLMQKADDNKSCTFYEESHDSSECNFIFSLPLNERKEIIMRKRCCFKYFQNHLPKHCKIKIFCTLCFKSHSSILCFANNIKNADNELKVV